MPRGRAAAGTVDANGAMIAAMETMRPASPASVSVPLRKALGEQLIKVRVSLSL
jgi:hypothetical protein